MNAVKVTGGYQISSKTGMRHLIDGRMPGGDEALRMWRGAVLPVARCGKALQVVNFYELDELHINPRYRCSRCFSGSEQS